MSIESSALNVERSAPRGAVFLSYASQDAEAARRICEALRAGGMEVWFDADGGLEHGDEWDAKIRRQVKECVLFIPVISANTQAREEGYFRIEWDLAAERARGIASGVPFILPVVIDDTREPDALVPDRFRMVQWTKLRGGEVPPEVQQRFLKLWSHRTGVLKQQAGVAQASSPAISPEAGGTPALPRRRVATMAWSAIAIAIIIVGGGGWWLLHRSSSSPTAPIAVTASSEAKPAATEAAQLTERAYALTLKVGFTRDELSIATDLTRRATELESGSGRAWAVRAWVQGCYLMRNWDLSDAKLQEVQALANRALTLAPRDADAMNALYQVFEKQRSGVEAEKIARRAIEAAPDNYRSRMCLGRALAQQGRFDESLAVLREAVERFPTNVLCRYELAAALASIGPVTRPVTPAARDASLEQLDAAIAVQPFASAILLKAETVAAWSGDLTQMRRELDRMETMPLVDRSEDRAVYIAMWAGLLERRPDRVLEAAKLTTRPYFEDAVVAGAKAWSTALAYQIAGKEGLARQEWLAAEATLRPRVKDATAATADTLRLAATLAWLGRMDEAAQLAAPVEAAWREDLNHRNARLLALYYGARGDAAKAVPYLRQAINYNSFFSDYVVPLDPWWDKLRPQPEFAALLAEAKARTQTTPGGDPKTTAGPDAKSAAPEKSVGGAAAAPVAAVSDKSLVVLPLENLSPDPENAFFTDGMHVEMINALSRVTGLKVISRPSSLRFKGTTASLADIAQQVGVANVITGSVRRAAGRVKIQLELRRARDEALLLTKTYDRELSDVIAIQTEVAADIARALEIRESRGSFEWARYQTKNPEAYDRYLKAVQRYLTPWGQGKHGLEEAEGCGQDFQRVVDLDPNFAAAVSFLSRAHTEAFSRTPDAAGAVEHARLARKWAEEFARLMPGGGGDGALSLYYSNVEYRPARAAEFAENVIRALPNDATGNYYQSVAFAHQGREAEAAEAVRRALELDPLNATYCRDFVGAQTALRRPGEAEAALAQYRRVTGGSADLERVRGWRFALTGELPAETPGLPAIWLFRLRRFAACVQASDGARATTAGWDAVNLVLKRGEACERLGRADDAKQNALEALGMLEGIKFVADSRIFAPAFRARALAAVGRFDEALDTNARGAADYAALGNNVFAFDTDRAVILARAGRTADCVELVKKLLGEPSGLTVPMLKVDPVWDHVREDPAFKALLAEPKNSAPL